MTRKNNQKNLIAIALTRLIHGFGFEMFYVIYQPFLLEITNSIVITGIIVSLGSIMQFLPTPIIGKISDKYQKKLLLILSIVIYVIGLSFLIVSTSLTIYYAVIGIMIYFLGFTLNNLNTQFVIAENSDKSKGFIYGIMFFVFFSGRMGGSALVILVQGMETRIYFLIFIVILAIEGLIYGTLLSKRSIESPIPSKMPYSLDKKENLWLKVFKKENLRSILIFFTLDIFVYGLSLSIYYAGLRDFYFLTEADLAITSLGFNATNMLLQIPAGKITDKIGSKIALIFSQIFGLGFFFMNILAFFLWNNSVLNILPVLIISLISLAGSVVLFVPAEQIILTDLGENRKAESYGIIAFVRGIGYIPTGYIAGLLVENLTYVAPFIFSIFGVFIEILFLLRFFHHHPQSIN